MKNHCFDLFIHSVEIPEAVSKCLPPSFLFVYSYPFLLQNKAAAAAFFVMKDGRIVAARPAVCKRGENELNAQRGRKQEHDGVAQLSWWKLIRDGDMKHPGRTKMFVQF